MRRGIAISMLAVVLAACDGGGGASVLPSGSASVLPSATEQAPVLTLSALDAEPAEHQEESVALAFDRAGAEGLLREVPADLDFSTSAVLCVFLGPRQTTGWSLDLRTATLTGNELDIAARENPPRGSTRPEVTYPADCGLLSRAALPSGRLVVRADDTITGEFIADTSVVVPEASNKP